MPKINYETDIPKHFVRRDGWLTASREQLSRISGGKRQIRSEPLKYFTFCAADAIDVFMLEKENVLKRNATTGRLDGVYFCERHPGNFGEIAGLIGSYDQGFRGNFEDIVLFEEDNETLGKTYLDEKEAYAPEVREKLRLKDMHIRLKQAFPFDIINLDVYGPMFPPKKGIVPPLLKSIMRILEWQSKSTFKIKKKEEPAQNFTLFLTSHVDPNLTNSNAITQLKTCLVNNIETVLGFKELFIERFHTDDVDKFAETAFSEFFCVSFPKYIIQKAMLDFGWKVSYQKNFLYSRPDKYIEGMNYQMLNSVAVYERLASNKNQLSLLPLSEYAESVKQILINGIEYVDEYVKDKEMQRQLEEDLRQIIQIRNQYRI